MSRSRQYTRSLEKIELENLNTATEEINKLELELEVNDILFLDLTTHGTK